MRYFGIHLCDIGNVRDIYPWYELENYWPIRDQCEHRSYPFLNYLGKVTLCNSTVQPHVGTLYHKQWFSEARKGNSWAKMRKWWEKNLQYVSEPSMKHVGKKPRHHPKMSWYQKLTMMMMLCINLTWVTPCQHSPQHYLNSPLNPYPLRGEESLKFKFRLKVVKCAKCLCRCLGYI